MNKDNLVISTDAAKTIGLNEAVLLEILNIRYKTYKKDSFTIQDLLPETPFWKENKLSETLTSLSAKGIIKLSGNSFYLVQQENLEEASYAELKIRQSAELEDNWLPEPELLQQIGEYGIPDEFALSYVDEFKHLSLEKSERHHSWGVKFLRYVIKKWREQEITTHKQNKRKLISNDWVPDEEAYDILINAGVSNDFIEKEIPEFILYWSERNELSDIWSSKFISHIRRQWARTQNIVENTELPAPISQNWLPNDDFYDVLSLTGITKEFADTTISEFILYWKETGQSHNSWNSKFLQHVKYQAQREQKLSGTQNVGELDKRIEASWKTELTSNIKSQDSTNQPSSQEERRNHFKQLKEKHKI